MNDLRSSLEMKPRPYFDDNMKKELVLEISKEIVDWCQNETLVENIIPDIQSCLEKYNYELDDNGYYFARILEISYSYEPDAELVSMLDDFNSRKKSILTNHIERWVREEKITSKLKSGDKCLFMIQDTDCKFANSQCIGVIKYNYPKTAEFMIEYIDKENKSNLYTRNYEDVIPLEKHLIALLFLSIDNKLSCLEPETLKSFKLEIAVAISDSYNRGRDSVLNSNNG